MHRGLWTQATAVTATGLKKEVFMSRRDLSIASKNNEAKLQLAHISFWPISKSQNA